MRILIKVIYTKQSIFFEISIIFFNIYIYIYIYIHHYIQISQSDVDRIK